MISLVVGVVAVSALGAFAVAFGGAPQGRPDQSTMALAAFSVVIAQLGALLAVIPGSVAGAVAAGRDRGGAELLQLAPVAAGQVVRGAMRRALSFAALAIFVCLPPVVAVFTYAGLSVSQLVVAEVLTFVVVGSAAVLACSASSLLEGGSLAAAVSYGLLLALLLGTAVPGVLLHSILGKDGLSQSLLSVNPFFALYAVVVTARDGDLGIQSLGQWGQWQPSALWAIATAAISYLAAVKTLDRRSGVQPSRHQR